MLSLRTAGPARPEDEKKQEQSKNDKEERVRSNDALLADHGDVLRGGLDFPFSRRFFLRRSGLDRLLPGSISGRNLFFPADTDRFPVLVVEVVLFKEQAPVLAAF